MALLRLMKLFMYVVPCVRTLEAYLVATYTV